MGKKLSLSIVFGTLFLFSVSGVFAILDECFTDHSWDGVIDGSDVALFIQNYGRNQYNNPCGNGDGTGTTCYGDYDCDFDVDGTDMSIIISEYGNTCTKSWSRCTCNWVEGEDRKSCYQMGLYW